MKKKTTNNLAWSRLKPIEEQMLQKIMEIEHLNKSAAIRFVIRFVAKAYGLWPIPTVTVLPTENNGIVEGADTNPYLLNGDELAHAEARAQRG